MFKSVCAFLIMMGCSGLMFANTLAEDFQKSKDYVKSLSTKTRDTMNQFHPETTFKDYNKTPVEERHYQGVEAEKTDLSSSAVKALPNDAGGSTIVEHFGENQFDINKNSNIIKNAKLIEEESYALTHGISNNKVSCDAPVKACEIKTHEERCYTSRQLPEQSCVKKRIVSVNSEHTNQRADFEVVVAKKWTGYITVNLKTGAMSNGQGGHLTNPLTLTHPCGTMTATTHSVLNNGQNAPWVSIAELPSCQNEGVITFYISRKFSRNYPVQIALTVDVVSKPWVNDEHWENSCSGLDASGLCHMVDERCTDATTTRVIDGLSVTRDCWQYESRYRCSSAMADECRVPREKGCLQALSRCERMENNVCVLYEQTYRCQETECPAPTPCVKNLFCADGECTKQQATQNDSFGTSVIPLAVAGEAGLEFSKTQATLFSGHAVQCKVWFWDVVDCCSNKGWGDKLHIDMCREEDKALGKAKRDYLAHYVGEYCSIKDPVLGGCLEHKRTYCVFDSKMARIVQEEGRLAQLNPNALGDAKNATCAGLSVSELQQLDMGRIDFATPVYPYPVGQATPNAGILGDVTLSTPDSNASIEEMKRRIQTKAAK